MELKRTIDQWRGGDPEAMAYHMSEAAIMFAFKDAKADILALHADNERLRGLVRELADTELAEIACAGSMAPVEDILGRMFDLLTPNAELKGGR